VAQKGRSWRRVMRWTGRILVGLVALIVLVVGGVAAYVSTAPEPVYPVRQVSLKVEPTAARVAEGRRIASMICAGCHGDPATGRLSGRRMTDVPAIFGEIRTANITQDERFGIGGWTDGEIAYLLRTGIRPDGRFAPVMLQFPDLSDEDIYSIIAFLRSDDPMVKATPVRAPRSRPSLVGKTLVRFAMKPQPYPERAVSAPDRSDKVAFGRYLTRKFDCIGCHTESLSGGEKLLDAAGQPVYSANLTPHETGLLAWNEREFSRAVREGRTRSGRVLHAPMPVFRALEDDEVAALYAYLRTVPAVERVRPVPDGPAVISVAQHATDGQRVYEKYQCTACHGTTGVGTCDLRGAGRRLSDAQIAAFIRNPARTNPGSLMPAWEGVIPDEDLAPLAAYVRTLGEAAGTQVAAAR
jgi:mono/diheme cytochrome c family protein